MAMFAKVFYTDLKQTKVVNISNIERYEKLLELTQSEYKFHNKSIWFEPNKKEKNLKAGYHPGVVIDISSNRKELEGDERVSVPSEKYRIPSDGEPCKKAKSSGKKGKKPEIVQKEMLEKAKRKRQDEILKKKLTGKKGMETKKRDLSEKTGERKLSRPSEIVDITTETNDASKERKEKKGETLGKNQISTSNNDLHAEIGPEKMSPVVKVDKKKNGRTKENNKNKGKGDQILSKNERKRALSPTSDLEKKKKKYDPTSSKKKRKRETSTKSDISGEKKKDDIIIPSVLEHPESSSDHSPPNINGTTTPVDNAVQDRLPFEEKFAAEIEFCRTAEDSAQPNNCFYIDDIDDIEELRKIAREKDEIIQNLKMKVQVLKELFHQLLLAKKKTDSTPPLVQGDSSNCEPKQFSETKDKMYYLGYGIFIHGDEIRELESFERAPGNYVGTLMGKLLPREKMLVSSYTGAGEGVEFALRGTPEIMAIRDQLQHWLTDSKKRTEKEVRELITKNFRIWVNRKLQSIKPKKGKKKGAENTQEGAEDGSDGEAEDGRNGEAEDGRNGEAEDGRNGEAEDGRNGEAEDGRNGEAEDGSDGETEESSDGETEESVDGKPGDGRDGKAGDGSDGETDESSDDETEESSDGETEENRDGKAEDGCDGETGDGRDGKAGDGSDGETEESSDGETEESSDGETEESSDGETEESGDGKPGDGKDGKAGDGRDGETEELF